MIGQLLIYCAIMLLETIRYNGQIPTKLTVWSKYNVYKADKKYQNIAKLLGLKADTPEQGVEEFAKAVENLIVEIGLETNFKQLNVDENSWNEKIASIAVAAYED